MINFIIYENNKKYREQYIGIILKIIGSSKLSYKIIEIDKYDKNLLNTFNKLVGRKIFILNIDVPGMSGLDLTRLIRESEDWESQIIILSENEYLKPVIVFERLLILDYISKYYNLEKRLKDTLQLALKVFNIYKSIKFQYNGELYIIPHKDILYIKRSIDNNSIIITKNKKININKTITNIEKQLDLDIFFKTHRSCIVNISNITKIDLKNNTIYFDKILVDLLTRDRKILLKNKIEENSDKKIIS